MGDFLEDVLWKKLIATFQDEKLMLEGPKNIRINVADNITVDIE